MDNNYSLTEHQKYIASIIDSQSVDKYEGRQLVDALRGHSTVQMNQLPALETNDLTFVFFTRPNLNLSDLSLSRSRRLVPYSNTEDETKNAINKMIRGTLSPNEVDNNGLKSALLNHETPFIPLLSNTLLSISGFPDEVLKSWVSPAGMVGEQWGHVNSEIMFNGEVELSLSFQSIIEDPVYRMVDVWMTYSSMVRYGKIIPHPNCIASRETDYFTGIYVIVTNSRYKIKHIAKTRGYPIAIPKGEKFSYNKYETKSDKFKTFDTRFKCFGMDYDDPAIMQEFNLVMMAFNGDIRSTMLGESEDIVEVPTRFKTLFQNKGYPLIDLRYNTLEYVIPKSIYEVKKKPTTETTK
jgi:hypothetical protein